MHREAEREANKAQARVWLRHARKLREGARLQVLPKSLGDPLLASLLEKAEDPAVQPVKRKKAAHPFQCQECGRRTSRHTCPGCGSSDIDLAPPAGTKTGPGTPWREFPKSVSGDSILEAMMKAEDTGVAGWPLVPSKRFPGERTLSCPKCKSTDVTLTGHYAARGTGPGGRGRLGDPGATNIIRCESCRHQEVYA